MPIPGYPTDLPMPSPDGFVVDIENPASVDAGARWLAARRGLPVGPAQVGASFSGNHWLLLVGPEVRKGWYRSISVEHPLVRGLSDYREVLARLCTVPDADWALPKDMKPR